MSNANRDYAIVYDVKNSLLVLSRPLNFYLTDKNTSNIFVKLVTRVIVGDGIDQYTDIENASSYVLTMRVIKPDDEVKSIIATQHESESIFQFDLTEDFKDIPGKYICELTISNIVNGRQEFTTSDPFTYEVKRSILSNVKNIIEGKDTTVEKLLNDLDATKAELISQIITKANNTDLSAVKSRIDNIIANNGDTQSNSELLAIRTDTLGNDFPTAYNRIDNIENILVNGKSKISVKYKNGYIKPSNGEVVEGTETRIVSEFYKFENKVTFEIANGYRYFISEYDENKIFISSPFPEWVIENKTIVINPNNYYRIMLSKTDNSNISPSESSCLTINKDIKMEYIENLKKYDTELLGKIDKLEYDFMNCEKNINNYKKDFDYYKNFKLNKNYTIFNRPDGFNMDFDPITIFTDGNFFYANFDKNDFMVKSSNSTTYYVSTDGVYTNSGLERDKTIPLYTALNKVIDGDTIIIMEGRYNIDKLVNCPHNFAKKSINVIGEGDVVLCMGFFGDERSYILENDLICYTANGVESVILEFDTLENSLKLNQVGNLDDCINERYSFFVAEGKVYINCKESEVEKLIILQEYGCGFVLENSCDTKVYIENLKIVGGTANLIISKHANYNLDVILNKCEGYYNIWQSSGHNVFSVKGGNVIFNKCKAMFGRRDGFNYGSFNNNNEIVQTNFIEIDCIGASNGINNTIDSSQNGSTSHTGTKGIRINGAYYNNQGANVADVQENTQTLNLGCIAFDSCSRNDDYNQGFSAQQALTEMWLYNCISFGNLYDMYIVGRSTMHAFKCAYKTLMKSTKEGTVFDEVKTVDFNYYNNLNQFKL